jgi:PDZ domain-containing protein
LLVSAVLVAVFGLLGAFVPVPYVALGPGPTYDTLGREAGVPIVAIDGRKTYPTSGELRMTTVALNDDITLFGALGLWASGRYALAPREDYFPPGESDEQVKRENVQQFQNSQSNAEVAALRQVAELGDLELQLEVLAENVVAGSPADHVLTTGDRLLVINGRQIDSAQDVYDALAGTRPGETVSVTFQHDGQPRRTESVTLAQNPNGPQGFLGLQPVERADVPFEIDITLEDVGGPSAGMIFALAIVDRLTPGALVEGEHVAGTGTITAQGDVGPIGGISFKVVAAREAGATAFLVPQDNCAEAAAAAPDGLRLVKVTDLDSAVTALQDLTAGRPTPSC